MRNPTPFRVLATATTTTRAIASTIVFVALASAAGLGAQESARVVQLDVPLVGQEQDVWCWAASAEMILRALGEPAATQCAQATRRVNGDGDGDGGRAEGEPEADCCGNPKTPGCVRTGWPRFDDWGFEFENTKTRCRRRFLSRLGVDDEELAERLLANDLFYDYVKRNSNCSLSWEEVTAEIDAGYPIAFAYRYTAGGGHMMVAVGYVEEASGKRWVIVQDPWPPAPRGSPELGGDKEVVPWEHFLGGEKHEHWRDYWQIRRTAR